MPKPWSAGLIRMSCRKATVKPAPTILAKPTSQPFSRAVETFREAVIVACSRSWSSV